MRDGRTRVVVFYAYAGLRRDAVSRASDELCERLLQRGGFAIDQMRSPQNSLEAVGMGRVVHQFLYFVRALLYVVVNHRNLDLIVTIDVPSGIGYAGRLGQLLSGGRAKHISWVLDIYAHSAESPGRASLRAEIDSRSRRGSDVIVTIGSCMQHRLRAAGKPPVRVIPIWQDETWIGPTTDPGLSNSLNPDEKFVVMYSGHAGDRHPLHGLVRAAADLTEYTDVLFIIAGTGSEVEKLKAEVRDRELANVLLADPVAPESVPALLSIADVHFVSLSDTATGTCVPSKTYAAMAVGKPIIATMRNDSQAALDVVDANAGVVLPPTGEGLSSEILKMYTNRALAASRGAAARQYFLDERSLSSQSERWEQLIDELVGQMPVRMRSDTNSARGSQAKHPS